MGFCHGSGNGSGLQATFIVPLALSRGLECRVNYAAFAFCCFAEGVRERTHDQPQSESPGFPVGLLLATVASIRLDPNLRPDPEFASSHPNETDQAIS